MSDKTAIAPEEKAEIEARLQAFIGVLELEVEVEGEVLDEETLYFNIHGAEQSYFLGNKTENLRSLGLLMQTYLENRFPESEAKVKLDAAGFLRRKEEELRSIALEVAESLREIGDEEILDPMNPYDRRIVHLTLRNLTHLKTESIGEGHYKRMIIRMVGPSGKGETGMGES